MAQWQGRSRRKPSGGRVNFARGKRKREIGAEKQFTIIGDPRFKQSRGRSKMKKIRVLAHNKANVLDPKTGKTSIADVERVVQNPADPNYVQRNIITKGSTINTSKGPAKVLSRPGQHGVINAVLVDES